MTIPIITKGRLTDVKDFEELIVRALPDGSTVRLKDVARIELGAQSYSLEGRWNSQPTTFILTFLAPGANALDTVRRTRAQMDELTKDFPPGVSYDIPYDTTRFIEVSIKEVVKTLAEAMVLVVLVVYLFLQSWRATIIPTVAVPVSLIGTFIGLYALGFSINTITLFGMVLAIGIVVDDAIVVVENVERHMREDRLPAKDAAKRAMSEVTAPIIAIVLVLVSVFVPVGFVGGITGALYKQFAATIAISVTVSGFVALTLSPALCAMVLVPRHGERGGFWHSSTGRSVGHSGAILDRGRCIHGAAVWVMLLFGVLLVVSAGLFKALPKSFLPEEDQGYFIVVAQLPDGASKQRTDAVLERIERFFQANPAVHSTDALSGQNFVFGTRGPNAATMFVPLRLWDERTEPQSHAKALVGIGLWRICEDSGSAAAGLQCAGDPWRGGGRGILCTVARSQRRRFQEVRGGGAAIRRTGAEGACNRPGGDEFPCLLAAALCPCEPGAGEGPGDTDFRHLRYVAGLLRQFLHQRFCEIRSRLSRSDRGRGGVPGDSSGYLEDLCACSERPRART